MTVDTPERLASPLREMSEADELLAVRAAELYYDENRTQDEIGALLQVTRWKVGRLLAQARERGFIRIEIVHPRARRLPLERALCHQHGLDDAVVVPVSGITGDDALRARAAQAAADHLAAVRPAPTVLGVSWGRTVDDVAAHLRSGWSTGVHVVQVNGGVSRDRRPGTAAATAAEIARKGGGTATLLPVPAILERAETRRWMEADRAVADVLALADGASAYLFSAGEATAHSAHVESGYLSPGELKELVGKGAVGDVLGRYIDAKGRVVDPDLDARTLGLPLDALRAAGNAIAVIAGRAKHAVARAVVTSGLCTTLVTDEETARSLLSEA